MSSKSALATPTITTHPLSAIESNRIKESKDDLLKKDLEYPHKDFVQKIVEL